MKSLGANLSVGIGLAAKEFRIVAVSAERLSKLPCDETCALIVVGDDLSLRYAARRDLAVDQQHNNARLRRSTDSGNGCISSGIVEDEGGRV